MTRREAAEQAIALQATDAMLFGLRFGASESDLVRQAAEAVHVQLSFEIHDLLAVAEDDEVADE